MLIRASASSANAWVALCLTVGCSFVDPHADDTTACTFYARETCARLSSCSPWVIEQSYQSASGCRKTLSKSCLDSLAPADVLSSAAGVFDCASTMKSVTCSQLINNELPLDCHAPRGRRADGSGCEVDAQCASARCVKGLHDERGSCQELADKGGACADASDCEAPLICAANGRCSELGKRGVVCSENRPCRYPLSCLDDDCSPSTTGVCGGAECDPRSPERLSTACTEYAAALCTQLASCSPALVASVYGDVDVCSERTLGACQRSASAADSVGTGAGIAGCAAALSAVSCDDLLNRSLPEVCRLLPGQRDENRVCGEDAQCASLRCARAKDKPCGSCTKLGNEDEPCLSDSDCARGLRCSEAQVCARPLVELGSCTTNHPCAFPWVCAAGRCSATLTLGSNCDPQEDRCNPFTSEICGPLTLVCEPLRYEPAAGPCGYVDGGWTACGRGAACVLSGDIRRCVPAAAEGEACSPPSLGCQSPARCVDGICHVGSASECS